MARSGRPAVRTGGGATGGGRVRAYLQLLRLPNVFTAMADIVLGFLFTHQRPEPVAHFALLVLASSLMYLAGMVLNDYFDQEQDKRERPFRPIPSGRVAARTAQRLGFGMLAAGVATSGLVAFVAGNARPVLVSVVLAGVIVLYDIGAKRTPVGPVVMGACRMFNVLLGMSLASRAWLPVDVVVAGGIGVYIIGLTTFARSEARMSSRLQLILGLVIVLAGIGLLASLPRWERGLEWPPINIPDRWYVFWGLIALLIAWRMIKAIRNPRPELVQSAVRNGIFSLVILDAGAVLAVQDYRAGLAILALLIPTITLGRWIYST